MKQGIHPEFRDVCFLDLSNGEKLIIKSTVQTRETVKLDDGREVPLFKVESSANTHPFYTGTQKSIDSLGGRVDKFRQKYARAGAGSMVKK